MPGEDGPLPLNFYQGDNVNCADNDCQKSLVGAGEYDKSDGSKLVDPPVQTGLDPKSVKHEYIGEPSNTMNFDMDYLLDKPYFDATTGDLLLDESLFFDADDLNNAVEMNPGLDMLNEYTSFFNLDFDNLHHTFDSIGSENILPDSSITLENVNDGTHQVSEASQPFEGQNDDIASSSKQGHPDLGTDIAYPFLKKASYMLGNISAPPAFASEFPTKYLTSDAQASSSAHVTSGMIRISNVSFSGGAVDLSLGKHTQLNIVLSFGLGQRDINSAYPHQAGKANLGASRSWFYCVFLWILVLSLSFKIGSLVCPRPFMS